jgi:hypothetical protein
MADAILDRRCRVPPRRFAVRVVEHRVVAEAAFAARRIEDAVRASWPSAISGAGSSALRSTTITQ